MGVTRSGLWAPDVYVYFLNKTYRFRGDLAVIYLLLLLFFGPAGGGGAGGEGGPPPQILGGCTTFCRLFFYFSRLKCYSLS